MAEHVYIPGLAVELRVNMLLGVHVVSDSVCVSACSCQATVLDSSHDSRPK
jgi:hypothetical protein